MKEELRRVGDLARKHELEIQLMQRSQDTMNDQLAKLVEIQETLKETVMKMTTTLSNVAWVVGIMSVMSPALLYFVTQ